MKNISLSLKENKMKPKHTQRHTGSKWEEKGVNTGDKTVLHVSSPALVKPFAGKVFYLDLPSNRTSEKLERDIKELGGTVEKFFSKEIKYLVTNKREAKYVQSLKQDSPVPSPDSGQSSPHPRSNSHQPGSHGDNNKSRSQGQTDTFVTSRGKSLVERVVREQERVQMNKILSNALEWGVKILYIDDVIAYVQKKKKIARSWCPATTAVKTSVKAEPAVKQGFPKWKVGWVSKPFVKVEDSCRHYRPIYLTMPNMPEFNLKSIPPGTPFCIEDKDPPWNKLRGHRGAKAAVSEERIQVRKKNRDKKRGGYCECCMIKYENLTMHLQSERHMAFSKSDEYLVVDKLVSTLPCNFIQIKTEVKRPKCSVSSVLVVHGPCGKTELKHRGGLGTAESIKQEQQWTVDGDEGFYSGHILKCKTIPGSAPLTQGEDDKRNCYIYSDTFRQKSLGCKRLCRQNSLTSCSQKAEQAQIPQLKTETAPSMGPSSVSSNATIDPQDQISHKDMDGSTLLFPNINVQNEVSSICFNVLTNKQVSSDTNKGSLLLETVQYGNVSSEKHIGHNLSGQEEGSLPTQSSPVRKIQRRRVYKRRRRKVDLQHVKSNDVPDNSMLRLWQLFQSSDDMDVEFNGFED
ncbi:protein DBF4 homolog A [Mastacembelus armatus]|uniref:Protein DBF4 homolog A n=1 Tax=Mastacembelus armatus TaxID=205130 RepID=A0A3Q3M9D3_9TELE|nr:protein DBF4 homolog A [Mastacembelus armatus]XP_026172326.1 protein DBF4 homolog A [Mastacembelus armatus]